MPEDGRSVVCCTSCQNREEAAVDRYRRAFSTKGVEVSSVVEGRPVSDTTVTVITFRASRYLLGELRQVPGNLSGSQCTLLSLE